jgi:septum formation protein
LSEQKAKLLQPGLEAGSLLITADTIVWHENEVMEKPAQIQEARRTLSRLSGKWHEVITSVCFTGMGIQRTVHSITEVKFTAFSGEMIETYLSDGQPLDKAGAYGIQEWIGLVGVEAIKGSYTNVVGLPTQLVYTTLQELMG